MRSVIRAGLTYFGIVFGVGFGLGVVRVLWAIPRFGERAAELMEAPVMLLAIVLAARWIVARHSLAAAPLRAAGAGALALGLLLLAEAAGVVLLRGTSVAAYLAARDPVSGAVYLLLLAIFGALPALLAAAEGTR